MIGGPSPAKLAARLTAVAQNWITDSSADRNDRAQRRLLAAVEAAQPATLNQVAQKVGRGAPAVSRSVEALVRAGLIDRTADPDNRRRLALTVTEAGRDLLNSPPKGNELAARLERFAQSELRALERAVEILEQRH
ncbi:MAG: MarR family transcriptional regulator [Sphingomonas sp.]|nr:MarR family transcriptional regulator [Sphingomonas sp.]